MEKVIELNMAIEILNSTRAKLLHNNALFVMVLHAQQHLEKQMAVELHRSDMEASVMHALALNVAAREQRAFTMVLFDAEGKLVYRTQFKTRGQQAYERDVMLTPNYCNGVPRAKWEALPDIARWSWERNPTTFDEELAGQRHEEILAGLASEVPHSRIREANGTPRQWTYNGEGGMVQ